MKKLFFNDDDTIKTTRVIVITGIILLICSCFILSGDIKALVHNASIKEQQRPKTTTTFNLCHNCDLKFKKSSIELKVGESASLDELLELKEINIRNVNFVVDDKEIIKIAADGSLLYITALNKIGETTLTAKYEGKETVLKVIVSYNEIIDVQLHDKHYQVALGEKEIIALDTNPVGVDIKELDLTIKDPNIAYLDSDKRIIPVAMGTTEIILNFNGVITTRQLSVVKNRIQFYIEQDHEMLEVYELYTKDVGRSFDIIIEFQDNLGAGFIKDDLQLDIISNGLDIKLEYNGLNIKRDRSYYYKVNVTEISGNYNERNGIIKVSLPDGSSSELEIIG